MPSQKLGIDWPNIAIAINVPSIHVPLYIAAKIPNGIEPKIAINIENIVSSIVAGKVSRIIVIADWPKYNEFPKSNWISFIK